MSYTTLEDFFGDIIGKAMRGLGIDAEDLGRKTGLSATDIGRITSYDLTPDNETIGRLASALSLDGDKLARVASGWVPDGGNDPFETATMSVDRVVLSAGMEVNAYVIKCKATGQGALVDAGGQADRIQDLITVSGAAVSHILLTHGHGDHVGAVSQMKRLTGAKVYCSEADAGMLGSGEVDVTVADGWEDRIGSLNVRAFALPGHTAGGVGFLADGTAFFSGDALFAGSLGGARGAAYTGQIQRVREKVLSLGEETKIFPGHGPITTVGQEVANNPCFM